MRAYGSGVGSAKIEFSLTDYAYVTIKVKNLSNNQEWTVVNNEYYSPGSHQYSYTNNPGQYRATVIARSRFESSKSGEPPVEVSQTYDFYISDGGGGGGEAPPGGPQCPFLFPFTSDGYAEDNNILAGSFLFQRDTVGFYKLQKELLPQDGYYYLMIGEDNDFISYLNYIQLLTIDYPSDLRVAITPEGEIIS